MASRKGIAITAAIVAAIVGASFLIWFIPQSNPGSLITPRSDSEIISDVYSRHNDLADDIESKVSQWRQGNLTSEEILGQITQARPRVQEMEKQIQDANPAQEWQQSFDLYELALGVFSEYLDAAETLVKTGDTSGSDVNIEELRTECRGYVDQSVQAMPAPQ
ncbi:MAG TPA: hypothetical protein VIE86_05305 [Nitrososphaera sp.]